jgi:hypothetical protein
MIYQTQSKLNEKVGNATASLLYYKKYAAYKDSLFNSDMGTKFSELETKFSSLEKRNLYSSSNQKLIKICLI